MRPSDAPRSLGVSIVLYKTPYSRVAPLLAQLLAQGASEIFLVDNSAKDDPFWADWQAPPGITYIDAQGNLGYGRGHNLAIARSRTQYRYHLVCNPDVTLAPDTIAVLCARMEQRTDVGLMMPRVVDEAGTLQYLCKRAPKPFDLLLRRFLPASWGKQRRYHYEMRDTGYRDEMEVECLSGCFMFFRSQVLRELGGFDERFFMYMEDFDLSRRAARIGRNLYCPATTIVHGHARHSYRNFRLLVRHCTAAVKYFQKWGWTA